METLREHLKFTFKFNFVFLSVISMLLLGYYVYQGAKGKPVSWNLPDVYTDDTDFLLAQFWSAYDIRLEGGNCQPILRPQQTQIAEVRGRKNG